MNSEYLKTYKYVEFLVSNFFYGTVIPLHRTCSESKKAVFQFFLNESLDINLFFCFTFTIVKERILPHDSTYELHLRAYFEPGLTFKNGHFHVLIDAVALSIELIVF